MRRHLLPNIMHSDEGFLFTLHLCFFFIILTIWGGVHVEENMVGWHNLLQMKTSAY